MPKLTITKGLPGSGKSTWARDRIRQSGNTVRVNKDDIRAMMHNKWSGARERITEKIERAIVRDALLSGQNVIVDDTNLGIGALESWKYFAGTVKTNTLMNIEVQLEDFTQRVSIQECIRRDSLRDGSARVGRGVIEKMALRHGLIDLSKFDKVAIVDIDGTLANLDHRLHYIQSTPKNHAEFFKHVYQDIVFDSIWNATHKLKELGHTIIILSGRPTSTGCDTCSWLGALEYYTEDRQPVPFDFLFMRDSGSHEPDHQVKRQIFGMMLKAGLDKNAIKVVIDDREEVCNVWREFDLPLIQVDHGEVIHVRKSALGILDKLHIPVKGL